MATRVYRVRHHQKGPFAGRSEVYLPVPNQDGLYVLGSPEAGDSKHHRECGVYTPSLEEALRLVRRGYSLRMRGELTGQNNLIRPNEIIMED